MVSQATRYAPRCGNHIDINVAIVVSRESDLAAVRRKDRISLEATTARKQTRLAPITRHQPKIACIGERDVSFRKCWLLQKQRAACPSDNSKMQGTKQEKSADQSFHKKPPEGIELLEPLRLATILTRINRTMAGNEHNYLTSLTSSAASSTA